MSEFINAQNYRRDYRWTLLATASALALLAFFPDVTGAWADDSDGDRPTVWIQLGGQLERDNTLGQEFDPPFLASDPNSPAFTSGSPFKAQESRFSYGGEGKISVQPEGTDWDFSASIRYGRASSNRHIHLQTHGLIFPKSSILYSLEYQYYGHHSADTKMFADTVAKSAESHAILDFQVGKDFGLGLFGSHSMSNISLGVRFAQFSSKRDVTLRARPDLHFTAGTGSLKYWRTDAGHELDQRSLRGIGPSLSWNNSAPLFGDDRDSKITLDWGMNAAVLFGRQKAAVEHKTTGRSEPGINQYYVTLYQRAASVDRARFVTVPNIGGFAGVSFCYSASKVSFGYRGDFFFGAIDGGTDARKNENTSFYGPFATISVGLP